MAAKRIYSSGRGTQDHNPQQVYRAYERITMQEYPGVETQVGAQFWGTSDLKTDGLHNEVMFHTGLLGQAADLGDDVRASVPMATYQTIDQVISNWKIVGIGFEYSPEEIEDDLYDIVAPKVADLPRLLTDKEEDEHFYVYNNGETITSGVWRDPLFVDGASAYLQLVGQPGVNYGSNIITTAGGVSYHLINQAEQYGENFISEEGRISPLRIVKILCSPMNADLLRVYYGASSNIEQSNPNLPNPTDYTPEIVATHRLANPNDIIFFYEGWEQDLKEHEKYRSRSQTDQVGWLNQKKMVTITRSRFGYYWHFNRRVVLAKGAATA